ncbi:MAG: hypothetical protein AVDCRST_MAG02-2467, partial [uncultured Rubrobacteraceae bacterium]
GKGRGTHPAFSRIGRERSRRSGRTEPVRFLRFSAKRARDHPRVSSYTGIAPRSSRRPAQPEPRDRSRSFPRV